MKKRIMVIGPSGIGKTSLIKALTGMDGAKKGCQEVYYSSQAMDVPGAYLENPGMHQHLIALSQDASHILMLVDVENGAKRYPPGFAGAFACPVIGVMMKAVPDMSEDAKMERIQKHLGIKKQIFQVDTKTDYGMNELKYYISHVS